VTDVFFETGAPMKKYQGSCHCGAVLFTFQSDSVNTGMRCNCSFCKRKGAVMSTFTLTPEELNIDAGQGALERYQFDSKLAKHYFCRTCGINPFLESMTRPGNFRVNLGCIDAIELDRLELKLFDGKNLL